MLKGQCHEIFCFWFFSWISFPQASDYTIGVVSKFLENSQRYSQLKICHRCQRHRWQMEKTFKQKNFNNFVWKWCKNLPPVSRTGGKFATGVVDTGGAPWLANISANFRKNLKRSKWNSLGWGGKWIMEKTRIKKSRDTVPLNNDICYLNAPDPQKRGNTLVFSGNNL